jgi:hypothetical protein
VLLIAFVPIFLWQFGDMLVDWLRGEVGQGGALPYLGMAFAGALFGAALHAVFALVGTAIAWLVGKRKPAAIALAVALAVVIGLVYDAFNGNPLNEWLAKRELKAYLEATYPDQRFRIEDGRYNFKFSQYEFDVVEVGGTEDDGARIFSFAVRGFVPRVVLDGVRLDRLDKAMMERLGAQAAAEIEDLLRAEGIAIADVQVFLTVLQGELPEDAEWHKELPLDGGISLHITLDAADLSEADVLQAAERMQRLLNEAGYDYNGVVINANLLEGEWGKDLGPLKYAVSFKRDTVIRLEDIERFD